MRLGVWFLAVRVTHETTFPKMTFPRLAAIDHIRGMVGLWLKRGACRLDVGCKESNVRSKPPDLEV